MRLKKQFLHLYCNSNKKGFLTGNEIKITAMAFNDFSDRGKPDSMICREFESRFPLPEPLKRGGNKEQKPYVSMICKVFSFLG